jgi:hypothetical protein
MTILGISLSVISMILLLGKEPPRKREPVTRAVWARRACALGALVLGAITLVRALGLLEGALVASTAVCTAASLVPALRATYPKTGLGFALSLLVFSVLGHYA